MIAGSLRLSVRVHRDRNELLGDPLVQARVGLRQVDLILADRRHSLRGFALSLRLPFPLRFLVIRDLLTRLVFRPKLKDEKETLG